jgi:uncharacterized protein YcbK (DUF882 family)
MRLRQGGEYSAALGEGKPMMRNGASTGRPANRNPGRRAFLRTLGLALPAAALPGPWARALAAPRPRSLSFRHAHTQERLAIVYHDGDGYLPESLERINRLLRDFRTEQIHPIDPPLLDLLYAVTLATSSRGRFEVISGYRSPATNAMLRRNNPGVAKRSLHMQGRAIDVRLSDVDTRALRKAALALKAGGVGYYGRSNFVHLDTGRPRSWKD